MNRRLSSVAVVGVFFIGLTNASSASAQDLGTFRWQFAPYCNVVTVRIVQKVSVFELTGTDDGCDGAAPASTVNGSAHVNTNGSVGISLEIVRPDGFVINNSISLSQATLSGTWRDDWANAGTFVYNPPAPVAGSPKRLTMRGDWAVLFQATVPGGNQTGTSFSFRQQLPSAPASPAVNLIPAGSPPTANCPGTFADPQALPGQLCLYEAARFNASTVRVFSPGTGNGDFFQATPTGFGVAVNATAAGSAGAFGRWAVSVP
jgi:hypothetical protein